MWWWILLLSLSIYEQFLRWKRDFLVPGASGWRMSDVTCCERRPLFNLYIITRRPLYPFAAEVTGVHRRRLYLHHQLVPTDSLRGVLVSFIAFLRMLHQSLVVIRWFDGPLLGRVLDKLDIRTQFQSSVSGCVDSLRLAEELLNLPQSAELPAGDSGQRAAGCELQGPWCIAGSEGSADPFWCASAHSRDDLQAPIYSGCHGDKTSGYLQSRSYTTSPPSGSTADRQRRPQRRHRKLSPVNNFHKKNWPQVLIYSFSIFFINIVLIRFLNNGELKISH